MEGFDIIKSGSRTTGTTENRTPATKDKGTLTKGDKALDMMSDNFENILNLAGSIIEIQKMKVASDACLKKMAEDRKRILDEAQAYAIKKRTDTNSIVERMNIIRSMMQDFYAHSQGNLSGDDFCKIITEVVNQMGRVENEIR